MFSCTNYQVQVAVDVVLTECVDVLSILTDGSASLMNWWSGCPVVRTEDGAECYWLLQQWLTDRVADHRPWTLICHELCLEGITEPGTVAAGFKRLCGNMFVLALCSHYSRPT